MHMYINMWCLLYTVGLRHLSVCVCVLEVKASLYANIFPFGPHNVNTYTHELYV